MRQSLPSTQGWIDSGLTSLTNPNTNTMNEPTPNEVRPAAQKKSSKKPSAPAKPRAPRTVDPGIVAIRASAAAQVSEFRSAQASSKILSTIIEKRLPKLTTGDKEKLLDHLELKESVTPALPIADGPLPIDNGTRDA